MSSDNPQLYEVAGQIIKTMGEQAKDMMEVQEKKHRIDDKKGDTNRPQIQTQNNVVFAGTTSDILKAIRDEESKTIEHEPD